MIGTRLLFITSLTKNTFSKRTQFLLLYSLFTIPKNYIYCQLNAKCHTCIESYRHVSVALDILKASTFVLHSYISWRALAIHQPHYPASLLHFSNVPRQLRSSTSPQLSIPRTKLNLGKRAFSVAAPITWNELPTTLKSCESLASFRKNLKTHLFKIAFRPLKLMMTPAFPRLFCFVALLSSPPPPEDLSAIEVILLYYYY